MSVPLTLQLIARTAGFKKSMDEAQSSFRKATKKILGDADGFRKIGTNFKSAGTTISLALGAPILAFGGNIIKVAAEYEQAFVGVKKTVTASEEQFAALSAGIRKMATELPFSAAEIAKVAEQAGQLGLKQDEILGFTKVVLDFVTSSNVPLEDAAVNLARLGVLSGEGTEKTSQLASAIVALGNDIKGNENEVLELALNFGAMGKEIGISTEFALGFAASIVETGQKAEAGGTAMSEVFRRVSIAVAEGGEELDAIAEIAGTTATAFKRSLEEDAGEAIFALLEGINKIPGAAGDTLVAMDEIDFTGKRLGLTVLGLAGNITQTRKNIDLATKAYKENNASIQEAEKFYNTFISKIKILAGKFNETKIILGDTLIPIFERFIKDVLEPVAQKVSELATEFSKLSPDKQEFFVQLAAALVVSGPILIGLGFMITAIGTIFNVVAVAFFGVGGIIAAVVALGFWLIKVTGNWDSFSDSISKTTDRLTKSVEQHGFLTTILATLVKNLAGSSVEYEKVASTLDLVEDAIAEMAGEAADSAADILGIGESFQESKKKAKESTDGMKKGLSEVEKKNEEFFQEIKQASELESRRLRELMASDRAFGASIQKEAEAELIAKVQAEAQALFDIQEDKKTHAKWVIDKAKDVSKRLKTGFEEADAEAKERQAELKRISIQVANEISDAIVNGLDDPKEAWKNFARKTIEVLVQMAIEAILKAQVISVAMASATIGISLVTALLASLFGGSGSKQSKSKLQSATKSFLDNIKETLIEFQAEILSVFDTLTITATNTNAALTAIRKGIKDVEQFSSKGNRTSSLVGLAITGFNFTDIGAQIFGGLFGKKRKKSKAENALNNLRRIIVENAGLALKGVKEEARVKKEAIREIFNLIQKERNFIKDIDRTITGVKRAFFSDEELFAAQKTDITNLQKLVAAATGEEKLALSKDLKGALLASFETAKSLFNVDNSAEIQRLKDERLATIEKAGPGADARAMAISSKIQTLTDQQTSAKADLDLWQSSVITGLESVKSSGQSAFTQLFLEQVKLVNITVTQARDVALMNIALKNIQDSSNAAVITLQQIGKKGATNPLVDQLANQLFALRGSPIMLAQGGVVTKPMQAIIGESGPEAVIPLSKLNQGQTTININLNVKDAASLSTNKWEQILKENLGTAMERINRQGFRSSLQPKVLT